MSRFEGIEEGRVGVIEAVFEFLVQMVIEIVGQALFEIVISMGWDSLAHSVRSERQANPILAGIGHLLLGMTAGVVSLFILPSRVTPRSPLPGLSLILSPIGTGLVMDRIGEWWRERGNDRPVLFSFRAGATFAFGMALVRFVYVELGWRPF